MKGHAQLFCLLMSSVPSLHWASVLKGPSDVQVYHIQPSKYRSECHHRGAREKSPDLALVHLYPQTAWPLAPSPGCSPAHMPPPVGCGSSPAQRQSSNRCHCLRSKQVDSQFSALTQVHCQTLLSPHSSSTKEEACMSPPLPRLPSVNSINSFDVSLLSKPNDVHHPIPSQPQTDVTVNKARLSTEPQWPTFCSEVGSAAAQQG